MVTLREIADAAGVNATTVSKALRGAGDLNPETARRIRNLARELGYQARPRKNGPAAVGRSVGVICPELLGSYYARMTTELCAALRRQGVEPLLAVSDFAPAREEALLANFADRSLAGIICLTEQESEAAVTQFAHNSPIPVVVIAANYFAENHDIICVNEEAGIRYLATHLADLGHRRFAFLGDRFGMKRLEYLQATLAERDITLPREQVFMSELRHSAAGYELAGRVLAQSPSTRPTALVAEYDDIALGAMRRIAEAGLSVPGDLSVTGFDDADYCRFLPVGLTSVNCHGEELCAIAVRTLLRKLSDPGYRIIQRISITPRLAARESSGGVPKTFENNII